MGKGSQRSQTVTQTTNIPPTIEPFVRRQFGIGSDALSQLSHAVRKDLIQPFDPLQTQGIDLGAARALGEGGFFPTAENTFLRAAQGQSLDDTIDETALDTLRGTASGDFLFGSPGFNAAVDEATRRANANVLSRFGAGGTLNSGLARTAIGQAASDAFARQFAGERSNQLAAANTLAGLSNTERGRQLTAAGALPELALAAPGALSGFGAQRQAQAERERQGDVSKFERLVAAAQGTVPASALLGTTTSQPLHSNKAGSILGGIGLLGSIFMSSRTLKENFEPAPDVLSVISELDLSRYTYLGEGEKHLGPMAEDLKEKLGIGNGKYVMTVDAVGVLMKAVQELTEKNQVLEAKLESLCQDC